MKPGRKVTELAGANPRAHVARKDGGLGEGNKVRGREGRFPGQVGGNEILARIIYLAHGEDAETAFSPPKFRDVLGRGLSVNRVSHLPQDALEAKAQKSVSESGGKKVGYRFAKACCGKIRECRKDGSPVFEVCATPTEDDPSHADIRCLLQIPRGAANSRARRLAIYEKIMQMFERADISSMYGSVATRE